MPAPRPPNRLLALLYLLLALPLCLRIALLTPPLQAADEAEHVMRAAQIGRGGFIARRAPDGEVGGVLPLSLARLRDSFYALRFRPVAPVGSSLRREAASLAWGGRRGFLSFANTALYPPVFYLPASAALDAGRWLHLRLVPSLALARLFDASLACLIASACILFAGAAPALLAALLALPMTLSLFASCSQDAMLIAASALLAAWLGRQPDGQAIAGRARAAGSRAGFLAAGVLVGCLGAARPPYLVLALLLPLASPPRARRWALGGLCCAGGIALLWIVVGAGPCLTPTRAGGSLLGGAQMGFLLHHPLAPLHIAWRTLLSEGPTLLRETLGVLDWLDVPLPASAYGLIILIIAALVALQATAGLRRTALPVMAVLLASAALIFGLQYLSWSPAGSPVVEGVQGRYFIPLLLAATTLLPGSALRPGSAGRLADRASAGLLVLLLALDWHFVPSAIAAHYALAATPP